MIHRRVLTALLMLCVLAGPGRGSAALASRAASPLAGASWTDVAGKTWRISDLQGSRAVAFIFVQTQCPIANLYTPRINEMVRDYAPKGVAFFLVDPNREDSAAALRRYAAGRAYTMPVVSDTGLVLANALGANRTPEVFVTDPAGVTKYRGRIDDNVDRTRVFRSDCRDALDAVLAGHAVARPRTSSFGCLIFRDNVAPAVRAPGAPTWARDVAPILYKNCLECHRAGQSGPFALQTYAEARTWAASIKDYTTRRLMPPWKAVPGHGDFKDARVLTDAEITTVSRWAAAGAPEGNSSAAPKPPIFGNAQGWVLGKPDLVVTLPRPYHLAPEGRDVYREYVVQNTFDHDVYIRGTEFQGGNAAIVHHMILFFDFTGDAQKLQDANTDGEPGYTVPGAGIGVDWNQMQWVSGWAPGNTAQLLPAGLAYRLPKGAHMVLQVHYHKNGRPEQDNSRLGLYFTPADRVSNILYTNEVAYPYLMLAAGNPHQVVTATFPVGTDITVWGVMPHMHMLGRQIGMKATLPGGKVIDMVQINDWDFNWQETYRYRKPLHLPAGTRITLTAVYDNTDGNPHQPNHPPRAVGWGEQTTDEMCIGFYQMTVDRAARRVAASGGTH